MPPLNRRRMICLPNSSLAMMVRAAGPKPDPRAIVGQRGVDLKAAAPRAAVPVTGGRKRVGPKVAVVTKADQVIAVQVIAVLKAGVPRQGMAIVGPKDVAMTAIAGRAVREIADRRRAVLATARPKAVALAALEGQEAAAAECAVQCPGNPEALAACPVQWPDRPATGACLHRSMRGLTSWSASSTKSSAS
jgi:hypothetical protein